MYQDMEIIKRGKCFYDNIVEYEVRIVKGHIFYGSGDYEDPPEIRDDQDIECYYVWCEDLTLKGNFNIGAGGFLSLDEAVKSVEAATRIQWIE